MIWLAKASTIRQLVHRQESTWIPFSHNNTRKETPLANLWNSPVPSCI